MTSGIQAPGSSVGSQSAPNSAILQRVRPYSFHTVGVFTRTRDGRIFDVETAPRDVLIAVLRWNDPNGCYTDADNLLEFDRVLDDAELRALAWDQFWQVETIAEAI